MKKWLNTVPTLEDVSRQVEKPWPEEQQFDKIIDDLIAELWALHKAYRN